MSLTSDTSGEEFELIFDSDSSSFSDRSNVGSKPATVGRKNGAFTGTLTSITLIFRCVFYNRVLCNVFEEIKKQMEF